MKFARRFGCRIDRKAEREADLNTWAFRMKERQNALQKREKSVSVLEKRFGAEEDMLRERKRDLQREEDAMREKKKELQSWDAELQRKERELERKGDEDQMEE